MRLHGGVACPPYETITLFGEILETPRPAILLVGILALPNQRTAGTKAYMARAAWADGHSAARSFRPSIGRR